MQQAKPKTPVFEACPGSLSRSMAKPGFKQGMGLQPLKAGTNATGLAELGLASRLDHWPIQLHLVNPRASHFINADLLIAADCTAFSCGAFHQSLLAGKKLVIACPKLDSGREIYISKIRAFIEDAKINSITLAVMEVPCCSGLRRIIEEAAKGTSRAVPISTVVIGIEGGTQTWL